jgi:hypothetical protein
MDSLNVFAVAIFAFAHSRSALVLPFKHPPANDANIPKQSINAIPVIYNPTLTAIY